MEFASIVLASIWTFYTTEDENTCHATANTLIQRFVQVEGGLGEGPYFSGERFSLVDAAFAPVFRYFDVFEEASGISFFANTPKLRAGGRLWLAAPRQGTR